MAESISFRPLSLGPMTSLGGPQPGRNPFASFAKGAGASLNPAGAAAAANPSSASAPREERKKKNPADIVSYDTEFLMGFAKVWREVELLLIARASARARRASVVKGSKQDGALVERKSHRLPGVDDDAADGDKKKLRSPASGCHFRLHRRTLGVDGSIALRLECSP